MGSSLAPFFRRLANLAPADRAFAVHFGQFSPSAARLADARQAPPLPRYVPAARPVQTAQAQPARTPAIEAPQDRDRRSRRERERDARQVAPTARRTAPVQAAAATPVQIAAAAPLPGPPPAPRQETPLVQPLPAPRADEIDAPIREAAEPMRVARNETSAPERSAATTSGQGGPAAVSSGGTARAAAAPTPAPSTPTPKPTQTTVAAAPAQQPVTTLPDSARPATGGPEPQPVAVAAREPAPPGPARVGQEDTVLAAIVAGITIPGEELQIVNATPVDLPPEPVRVAAATSEAAKPAPAKPKPELAKSKDVKKAELAKPDPKAKKPDPAKPDPKAKKPDPKTKAEPARVWVQVAGGANQASLSRAWKAVVAKAPALKGKAGWWTPLRATNRVLTGPFKTAAEAQAFVNTLGKSGVSGFVFTSEAGQKVTKLGAE
jgi:hypothetical protein